MRGDVLLERHLVGTMPAPPEPVPVPRLVHGDSVDPGAQARLAAEAMDGSEDPEKDFLGKVERFLAIAKQVHRQLDDHPLMFADQVRARSLVASGTPLNEAGFAAVNV
jgi:hypothetical protein